MVKALLLVFDKVALIGHGARVDARASERGQWRLLAEMGLVANLDAADTLALVDIDSLRTLFDVLLARQAATRSKGDVPAWRKSVVHYALQRLGAPAEAITRVFPRDATTLEVISTAICWIFEESIAASGVSAYEVTTERATVDAFTTVAAGLAPAARTVMLPCEWVLPPCGEASVEQLMDFRTAAGPSYRRYLDRLKDAMTSLSRRTDAALDDGYSPDQVADEIYALRRLMRDLPWLGRGYVGFGLTGNADLPRLRNAEDVARAVRARRTAQQAGVRPRCLFTALPARTSWI